MIEGERRTHGTLKIKEHGRGSCLSMSSCNSFWDSHALLFLDTHKMPWYPPDIPPFTCTNLGSVAESFIVHDLPTFPCPRTIGWGPMTSCEQKRYVLITG